MITNDSQPSEDLGAFVEDAIDESAAVDALINAANAPAESSHDAIVQDMIASMRRLSTDPARRREVGLRLV